MGRTTLKDPLDDPQVAAALRADVTRAFKALGKHGWPDANHAYSRDSPQAKFVAALEQYAATSRGRRELRRIRERELTAGDDPDAEHRANILWRALDRSRFLRRQPPPERAAEAGRRQAWTDYQLVKESQVVPDSDGQLRPRPSGAVPVQYVAYATDWLRGYQEECAREHRQWLREQQSLREAAAQRQTRADVYGWDPYADSKWAPYLELDPLEALSARFTAPRRGPTLDR